MLREVEPDSPAEQAGIEEGELLLEVNEELITHLKHSDVVNKIRQSGQQVTLTTISPQGQSFFSRVGRNQMSDVVEEEAFAGPCSLHPPMLE